jgi:hypothetical protein
MPGQLRAVYDDGKRHSEGTVKGMWSSGIVLETDIHPSIGSPVALVVLSGGFDGDRLTAQVAGFEGKNALLLDLPGLDPVRWARLQALVDGKPLTQAPPLPASASKPPPSSAPVFIISGGEDAQGEPTGVFNLTADMQKKAAESQQAAPASPFQVPSPLDPFPFQAQAAPAAVARQAPGSPDSSLRSSSSVSDAELSAQKKVALLSDENSKLRSEVTRLGGLNAALQEELKDALAKLDAIERMMKR